MELTDASVGPMTTILVQSEGEGPLNFTPELLQAIVQTCSPSERDGTLNIMVQNTSTSEQVSWPAMGITPDMASLSNITSLNNLQQNGMHHTLNVK